MAAPLSGIGQQTTTTLPQANQPVSNDQQRNIRQNDQTPRSNQVQARGAASSESQNSNNTSNQALSETASDFLSSLGLENQETAPRGSVVNLVV